MMVARTAAPDPEGSLSLGRLFPEVPALIAREPDGFLLISASGMQSRIRGPICKDIDASLLQSSPTPGLQRLATAQAPGTPDTAPHWGEPRIRPSPARPAGFCRATVAGILLLDGIRQTSPRLQGALRSRRLRGFRFREGSAGTSGGPAS